MVSAGLCDVALALGVEKLTASRQGGELRGLRRRRRTSTRWRRCWAALSADRTESGPPTGAPAAKAARTARGPCSWTLRERGTRHMRRYGTTVEQFAGRGGEELVPRRASTRGRSPRGADRRRRSRRSDDRRAPDPAHVLPVGDGAAAVVVMSTARHAAGAGPPGEGGVEASCTPAGTTPPTSLAPSSCARRRRTRRPASGRPTLDCVELHDASGPGGGDGLRGPRAVRARRTAARGGERSHPPRRPVARQHTRAACSARDTP